MPGASLSVAKYIFSISLNKSIVLSRYSRLLFAPFGTLITLSYPFSIHVITSISPSQFIISLFVFKLFILYQINSAPEIILKDLFVPLNLVFINISSWKYGKQIH